MTTRDEDNRAMAEEVSGTFWHEDVQEQVKVEVVGDYDARVSFGFNQELSFVVPGGVGGPMWNFLAAYFMGLAYKQGPNEPDDPWEFAEWSEQNKEYVERREREHKEQVKKVLESWSTDIYRG